MKSTSYTSILTDQDKDNPTVILLLDVIRRQAEEIEQLKDEINRLKNHPRKPKLKPSSLDKKTETTESKKQKGKRPGSKKKKKTAHLKIHDEIQIEPEYIPEGSRFIEYKDFVVQGIKIEPYNIRYRLKVYKLSDGSYVTGKLPEHLDGKHFSSELISFILYQHYHCHVTQPLVLELLHEFGIEISKGTLSNILIEKKQRFHQEKDRILAAGLEVSSYVNVDDTGARHKGKNGYCTHIGNETFSWFESTESKSRVNFLKLMRAGYSDYMLNQDAICYMMANGLPQYIQQPFIDHSGRYFANDDQWNAFLINNGIVKKHHQRIATEGALIGSIIDHGISKDLVIVSDDAGQFNVLIHALCWIHAERSIEKVIPYTDEAKDDLDRIKDQIWFLYYRLKQYKENPNQKDKRRLESLFDNIFTSRTHSATLNETLKRNYRNKAELLMVLDRPEIPLHNNGAENSIREYVKRRKISGSTRSDSGRRARDTFTSLKQTCRKLGISFWKYLNDRIGKIGKIPNLPDLIRNQALSPT